MIFLLVKYKYKVYVYLEMEYLEKINYYMVINLLCIFFFFVLFLCN